MSQIPQDTSKKLLPFPSTIPNNLPPRGIFIGRDDKKQELYETIKSNARLVVVEGVSGIGKTSLALEVVYRYLGESLASRRKGRSKAQFSAFIWITAKASSVTIEGVLDTLARTLDYPYISQLELGERVNETINLLRKIKTLIVIDNFETISDGRIIQFIENVPEPTKALITTRYQRAWSTHYRPFTLQKLQIEEGLELIIDEAKRLGFSLLLQSAQSALIELYEVTGGSPLAIKWAIGQMKQRGQSLASISAMLRAARGDIFEAMFAESWKLLSNTSKQVLLALPIFAATVSRKALAATANIHSFDFDEALGQLVELGLIEAKRELIEEKLCFGIHPLTRSFVSRELSKVPELEVQMRLRAVQYYLQFCNERRYLQRGLKSYDEIEAEVANILKVLEWLYDRCKAEQPLLEAYRLIISFSDAINGFFWTRGFWSERAFLCKQALEASEVLEDWASAGRQACFIGIVRFWQGAVEEAGSWAEKSMVFMERAHSPIDMAFAQRLLGLVAMGKGNYEQATAILKAVLETVSHSEIIKPKDVRIFTDWVYPGPEGYKAGIASLLQELGIIATRQGDHPTALKWLEDSRVLAQQIGDGEGLAVSLSHLGHALFGLRRFDEAKTIYSEGLELATRVQRKSTMGRCNQGLANVASVEGRAEDVVRYGQEAVNLFERLGMQEERQYVESVVESNRKNRKHSWE